MKLLKPEPLTAEAFSLYGDVIECSDRVEKRDINYGHTVCYHDLAKLDLTTDNGRPIVRLFQTMPLPRPIPIRIMERHPLSSQTFYPLSGEPYLVIVAEKGIFNPGGIRAFLAAPSQGVNYHPGTWHHFSLALNRKSDFLVIDRAGPGKNCDEVDVSAESLVIDY
jgi:ureidoglycolate lyase